MALWANLPFGLWPGMGMNAYFAYTLVAFKGTNHEVKRLAPHARVHCTHAYTHAYTHAPTHLHTHVHTRTCTCPCTCACTYTHR